MRRITSLLFSFILTMHVGVGWLIADDPASSVAPLRSLHGTMITMISDESGMAFEIWAKDNNVRSEFQTEGQKVISIQRGHIVYTFGEGSKTGMKQVMRRGLGTMGLIRQIDEIKAHGKKQGSQEIEGVQHDIYNYDVNAPAEMAMVFLSQETSLPSMWISVLQTDEETAQALRMIYRDMEANVEISDKLFAIPKDIEFSGEFDDSVHREASNNAGQQRSDTNDAENDSNLFVVIAPSANVMSEKTVLDTRSIGDVLKISRKQGEWLYVEHPGRKGWVRTQDVVAMGENALGYFDAALDRNPQEPNALLGRAKLVLWVAQTMSSNSMDKEQLDTLLAVALADFSQLALSRPSVDAFLGRGRVRDMQGKFDLAIADFDRALEIAPGNAEVIRHRAMAWVNADEFDKAIIDFDRIIKMDSKDAEALSMRCFALGLKGEWDQAMLSCDTAIRVDPKLASAYMRRGAIWAGKGDDIHAKADYDEAIRLGDDSARAMRSQILYRQGDIQKAIDDLNVVIELQPKNPEFLFQRGTALMQLKDLDRALADLNKAIELSPTAAAFSNRGVAWAEKNETNRAIADFTEAIKLAPNAPLNYQYRARLYSQRQQHKEAAADLTEYLRLVPNEVGAHVQRGLSRYFSADFDNAIPDFDYAIDRFPNDPELHLFRGSVWNAKKDFDRAVSDFSRTIELDSNSVEAYAYRGVAWNELGEKEKALEDFNEAIRLNPAFEIAYINRGSFWLLRSEYGKALTDFREALRLNPTRAAVLNEIAAILATAPDARFRNGKESVELATRACELTNQGNDEYLSTLAAAYAELGEFESAVEWQKKSLDLASDDAKKDALLRLELFQKEQPYRRDRKP